MTSLLVLWVHMLSAIFWVGGMLFLTLVLAPIFRADSGKPETYLFFQKAAKRFRSGVWGAILLLFLTGLVLLSSHVSSNVPLPDWPVLILTKLGLVLGLVIFAGLHDLVIGPRVGALKKLPPTSLTRTDQLLLNLSPWIARGILLWGIGVVCAGTAISRW